MEIRSRIFCVLLNSLFLSPKSVSAVRMYGDETDIRRFCAFLSIPFAGLLKKCRWLHFLFCLLAVLGLYLVGVGVTLSRRRRHTCFAYVSIPTTTRYGRGEHCSPAKKHKDTFSLWYFCVTKSTKSHLRGLSSLLKNTFRVHELVARAMRGKCVRYGAERKSMVLPLSAISAIPRVRTYHTKKPSRFVHALPARPL